MQLELTFSGTLATYQVLSVHACAAPVLKTQTQNIPNSAENSLSQHWTFRVYWTYQWETQSPWENAEGKAKWPIGRHLGNIPWSASKEFAAPQALLPALSFVIMRSPAVY